MEDFSNILMKLGVELLTSMDSDLMNVDIGIEVCCLNFVPFRMSK